MKNILTISFLISLLIISQFTQHAKADINNDLSIAVFQGSVKDVENAINKGADVNALDNIGWTHLYTAASNGQLENVEFLIKKGANVNAKNSAQAKDFTRYDISATPLHITAVSGAVETMKVLIKKGANVNAKNDKHFTPLHIAAENGHLEIIQTLIANGANVNEPALFGVLPIDLAKDEEIIDYLMKNGSRKPAGGKYQSLIGAVVIIFILLLFVFLTYCFLRLFYYIVSKICKIIYKILK